MGTITEMEVEKYPIDMQAKIWMKRSTMQTEDDIIHLENMIEREEISTENIKMVEKLIQVLKNKQKALLHAIKSDGTNYADVPYIKD